MAGRAVVEIEMQDAKAQNTLGGLNEKLGILRKQKEGVEVGSKAFKDLATEIQQTESKVKTLNKQMEGLEPQQKAEAFLKMGEGIAGGFVAAQGAMTLMGLESENLERVQAKVQGAIAIAMGVRMMSEAALMATTAKRVALEKIAIAQTKMGIAVIKLAGKAAKIYAAGLKLVGIAANVSSKGMKVLKIAIMSTGIGLLVVAIGTIAAYWDDIVEFATGVSSEMRDQLASATAAKDAALENMEATEGSTNQLKLAGKSQREILQLKMKDIEAAITASEIEMQRQKSVNESQYQTAKANKEILQGLLAFLMAPMDAIVSLYNDIVYYIPGVEQVRLPSEWIADKVFDPEGVKAEGEALIKEMEGNINKLKEKHAGFQLEVNAIDKAGSDSRSAAAAKAREEEVQRLNKFLQEMQKAYDEAHLTAEETELKAAKAKYDRLIAEAEHFGYSTIELEADRLAAIKEIEDRYAQEKKDKIQDILDFQTGANEMDLINAEREYDKKIELAEELNMDTTELYKLKELELQRTRNEHELAEQEEYTALQDAKLEARVAFSDGVASIMTEMVGLFGEGTKASKAAALAEIAINTGAGFMSGLRIAQKSADATGPGAMLAFPIFYATQIAAVLGAVKKAKSALGAGGGGASPPPVPKAAPQKSGNFTLKASGSGDAGIAKAYVVTDEMSDSQAQLADIRRRSTI